MRAQALTTPRHVDHRVLAVYDEADATVFQLRHDATLGELCELLAMRAPRAGTLPQHVEVHVGH